ncbi:MAG: cyanophycin synthetase [Microgenomates group bacterium]
MKQNIFLFLLRWAAKRKLKRLHPFVIAVTGSVGKSTCLTLLDGVISPNRKTRTTKKGNSESGLPLEILGIREELTDYRYITWIRVLLHALVIGLFGDTDTYEVLIAEFGIDSPHPPKNMSYLLSVIPHPDIAMVLSVAAVHTEQFSDGLSESEKTNEDILLSRIAKEKMLLAQAVRKDGYVIVQGDSSYIMKEANALHAPLITVGTKTTSHYQILDVHAALNEGSSITFVHDKKTYQMAFPHMVVFPESASIIVSVIAATTLLSISVAESIKTIEKISRLPPGRFSILRGKKQTTIIDGSYNASPESMKAALLFLRSLEIKKGKRIAVLGDMRELGPLAEKKHKEIAEAAAKSADLIVCVGSLMRQFAVPELVRVGFDPAQIKVYETSEDVGLVIASLLRPNDVILVKGSQNTIFLETIVKDLLRDETDIHLLCRQSAYWQEVRRKFFYQHPNTLYDKATYTK